jgi:hypothetical protein
MIRENPDGTRRQLEFYSSTEEEDADHFIRTHNLQTPEWRRTGDVVCTMCGQHYGNHRIAWPWFALNRICSGEYVKL